MKTSKAICEIFADALISSQGAHSIWKDIERRTITLTDELREAMCAVMGFIWCRGVKFGSYDCQTQTKDGVCVDYCLEGEIMSLRNAGVATIGCCCGHAKAMPYIQVAVDDCPKMRDMGYMQLPIDNQGDGQWCFVPKTILPKAGEQE